VPLGAASVPSTALAAPDSARATLMTTAPLPSAACCRWVMRPGLAGLCPQHDTNE